MLWMLMAAGLAANVFLFDRIFGGDGDEEGDEDTNAGTDQDTGDDGVDPDRTATVTDSNRPTDDAPYHTPNDFADMNLVNLVKDPSDPDRTSTGTDGDDVLVQEYDREWNPSELDTGSIFEREIDASPVDMGAGNDYVDVFMQKYGYGYPKIDGRVFTGGEGADIFNLSGPDFLRDGSGGHEPDAVVTITDFSPEEDTLVLAEDFFDLHVPAASDMTFELVENSDEGYTDLVVQLYEHSKVTIRLEGVEGFTLDQLKMWHEQEVPRDMDGDGVNDITYTMLDLEFASDTGPEILSEQSGDDDAVTLTEAVGADIQTHGGEDTVTGTATDASIFTGSGNDVIDVQANGAEFQDDRITVNPGEGSDQITISAKDTDVFLEKDGWQRINSDGEVNAGGVDKVTLTVDTEDLEYLQNNPTNSSTVIMQDGGMLNGYSSSFEDRPSLDNSDKLQILIDDDVPGYLHKVRYLDYSDWLSHVHTINEVYFISPDPVLQLSDDAVAAVDAAQAAGKDFTSLGADITTDEGVRPQFANATQVAFVEKATIGVIGTANVDVKDFDATFDRTDPDQITVNREVTSTVDWIAVADSFTAH